MMKRIFALLIGLSITLAASAQKFNNIIHITNTQIIAPDTIVLDTLNYGEQTYIKLIIKNERANSVEIKNIKTPPGTGATINTTTIKPKGQAELYIGFDTNWMNIYGNFVAKITLETNLIKDIVVNVKGFVKQNNN